MDDGISTSQYSATSTHVTSPLLAETLAVLAAMNFAYHMLSFNRSSLWLSDTHQYNQEEGDEAWDFGVLRDIYHLYTAFKSILFNFISR